MQGNESFWAEPSDGPDGALTSSDLGWVFYGAGAQGLSASQS